jgi:3-methyl-2-oxobutanoate hydroxymethyltransferase
MKKSTKLHPLGKVTPPLLSQMKAEGRKIVALTCYDYGMAKVLNQAGIDLLLVGDSLGMVKLGYPSTLPVTVEDMVYHTRIVAKGNSRALLVTDMPFMSYHASKEDAVRNAGKMIKAGAEAVKIEGGREILPILRALKAAKIPVIGHLGMTPQSVHVFGGYKVQARDIKARKNLMEDAKILEQEGVSSIVIECVPKKVAEQITRRLKIPTIGIGAGVGCDGQVLVLDDLLGLTPPPLPRFVRSYAYPRQTVQEAAIAYSQDVRQGRFPDESHSYL